MGQWRLESEAGAPGAFQKKPVSHIGSRRGLKAPRGQRHRGDRRHPGIRDTEGQRHRAVRDTEPSETPGSQRHRGVRRRRESEDTEESGDTEESEDAKESENTNPRSQESAILCSVCQADAVASRGHTPFFRSKKLFRFQARRSPRRRKKTCRGAANRQKFPARGQKQEERYSNHPETEGEENSRKLQREVRQAADGTNWGAAAHGV